MSDYENVMVKSKDAPSGYDVVPKSEYMKTPNKYELFDNKGLGNPTDRSKHMPGIDGRNTSGTFSVPTPTDIRFPDKDATEFENNHGAFVHASASELREEMNLPDAPGGIYPASDADIPENWQEKMSPRARKAMARQLTGKAVKNQADADRAVKAEVDRRKELAQAGANVNAASASSSSSSSSSTDTRRPTAKQ